MRFLAVLTIIGCVGTVQWHSALWWWDQVGPVGIGWSIVLELVALWFWYSGGAWLRSVGAVASLVVLLGPLHHVTAPLWQHSNTVATRVEVVQQKLNSVQQEIEAQRKTLQGYRERSEDRIGWRDVQEKASQRLAELREKQRRLLEK